MPRFDRVQNNFVRGELSPRLRGRTDFQGFFDGVETLENFIVQTQGGAMRRPGSRFVAETKDSEAATDRSARLIPFEVTTQQTYIVEAGVGYMRFYKNRERIENPPGTPIGVGTTPYTEAQLPNLKWTQSADVLYLANPDVRPKELRRTGTSPDAFQLVDHEFEDGPYLDINDTTTTLTPSAVTGNITITASSTTGINDNQGFLSTDVGRLVRIQHSSEWGWAEITAVNSTTSVDATVGPGDFGGTTASDVWRLGAWSDTTGWPATVTFHNERLCWGGTDTQPQTVWMSAPGDFTLHEPSAQADGAVTAENGITVTLATNRVNAIRWLVSVQEGLFVGTSGTEFILQKATNAEALSATNIEAVRQSNRGSDATVLPALIGRSIVFVQRGAKVIRESAFDFDANGFTVRTLSLLSEHLFRAGTARIAYQQNPDSVLWTLIDDGTMAAFTVEAEQEVFAWAPQVLAPSSAGASVVEDLAVIADDSVDQVWLVVNRTINGATKRYVEFIEDKFEDAVLDDAFFVDSGITLEESPATDTFTGLDHLEGETLTILADGATHPDVVVTGGSITLDRTASKVQAGLGYDSVMKTMPFESGQEGLVTSGRIKRIHKAHILFDDTVGGLVGPDEDNLERIPFRKPSDPMDAPPPLFSGLKTVPFRGSHTRLSQAVVKQNQPLPMHLLSVTLEIEVHGS